MIRTREQSSVMAAGLGAVQMLQKSLSDAQKDLRSTNDALRRLTGRDPERPTSRPGPERRLSAGGRMRAWSGDFGGPPAKRRDSVGSSSRLEGRLEGRLAGRLEGRLGPVPTRRRGDSGGEEPSVEADSGAGAGQPSLPSSVVATGSLPRPKGPLQDENSKKRNRRMFGFLMGTLQKFKETEEASKQGDKERRRVEIEERLQKEVELEREEAAQERKGLYRHRREQQTRLARIQQQMTTAEMFDEWVVHYRQTLGFIQTEAAPAIFYLPAKQTADSEARLEKTTGRITAKITGLEAEMKALLSARAGEGQEREGEGQEEGDGQEREGEEEGGEEAVAVEWGAASPAPVNLSMLDQSMEIGEGEGGEEA